MDVTKRKTVLAAAHSPPLRRPSQNALSLERDDCIDAIRYDSRNGGGRATQDAKAEGWDESDARHQQRLGVLDGRGESIGIAVIGDPRQPGRGVDHVHKRSSSRAISVSMPHRKPRSCFIGLRGISSIRSPRTMTSSFCPTEMLAASRASSGDHHLIFGGYCHFGHASTPSMALLLRIKGWAG